MKRTPVLLAAIVLLLSIASLPSRLRAQKFEGTIEMSVTTDEKTVPMTYMVKGDNFRMEMEGRPGMKAVMLFNVKDKKVIMVMDAMKMYMESPVPQGTQSDAPKVEFKKTGKTQKLLGYDCDEYIVTSGNNETDVWITDKLTGFELYKLGGARQRAVDAWQKEIGEKGGFPLLAVTKTDGKEAATMKVTKIEKKSLDDSLFKIPEGYQKMDTSMMRRPK